MSGHGRNALELDPRETPREIRRQRGTPIPGDGRPPSFPENGEGVEARIRAVQWWGEALTEAVRSGDRGEQKRLAHWWDERVEGWAEEVEAHLEVADA